LGLAFALGFGLALATGGGAGGAGGGGSLANGIGSIQPEPDHPISMSFNSAMVTPRRRVRRNPPPVPERVDPPAMSQFQDNTPQRKMFHAGVESTCCPQQWRSRPEGATADCGG
jgi:hypothetical protein